jgi:cell division septum initiation protein DivIVA
VSIEELEQAVFALREVELRRAVRGVDPEQVRQLLEEAADSLASAVRQQKQLRRELDQLQSRHDEEAIAKALVAATRTAEEIVAEAQEKAASITVEAEKQKAAMAEQAAAAAEEREHEAAAARERFEQETAAARKALEQEHESARAEAEAALAGARRELARIEQEEARLRALMAGTERRFVEIARTALDELEKLDAVAGSGDAADLLRDLEAP